MSLTRLHDEVFPLVLFKAILQSYIRISQTKTNDSHKELVDYENPYDKWKRNHQIKNDGFVNEKGSIFWIWSFVMASAVTYNLSAIPNIVFIFQSDRFYWFLLNVLSDLVYFVDNWIQSRLRKIENGCEETCLETAMARYKERCSLKNIAALFPLDYVYLFFYFSSYYFGSLSIEKFYSLFSIASLLRVNRLIKIERLVELFILAEKRISTLTISVWKIVYLCYVIFHWNACVYFEISSFQDKTLTAGLNATFDDDTEWTWPYVPEKVTDFYIPKGVWIEEENLLFDEEREQAMMDLYKRWMNQTTRFIFPSLIKQYVQSFYWSCMTITTLGEQPSPDDSFQTLFETYDTLVGMVVFAGIMGSVGALVGNANRVDAGRKLFMDGLKKFMRFRGVGDFVKLRVLKHCADELARGQLMQDWEVKAELPENVFLEIVRFTSTVPLARSPLFRGCGAAFLKDLGLQLSSRRLGPGDVLARRGEEQMEMFIVVRGQLSVNKVDDSFELISEGKTVGDEGIVPLGNDPNHWKNTIYSTGFSQIFVLTREKLLFILDDYPNQKEILKRRSIELNQYKGPVDNWAYLKTIEKFESIAEALALLDRDITEEHSRFVKSSAAMKRRLTKLEDEERKFEVEFEKIQADVFSLC